MKVPVMRPSEIAKEIDKLDFSEKLMLVSNIWDDIAKQNAMLPLPEWQKAELDKRYNAYKQGVLKTQDCYGVHEEIRNNYK
jgi:putative addiction module component (TIGR02574 family)